MKNKIKNKLSESAKSYLTNGLNLFHQVRNFNENFQVSLGNLSISIELILKTVIAENCFPFLFPNLPLDLKIKLSFPEIEERNPILKITYKDLESFSFDTLQLDSCISVFYMIYPEKKQDYKPYLRYLANTRNTVVHGAIPYYKKYDLEKIAYFVIDLVKFLQINKFSSFRFLKFNENDERFYKDYDINRINRVEEAIEQAKKKLNASKESTLIRLDDNWDFYICKCPICQSDALLNGFSAIVVDPTTDDENIYLQFYADSFKCDECGLELLDSKELNLAGIETVYNRPDEEIGVFIEHNREYLNSIQ